MYPLFLAFVILMNIVLMNLLIGLAVGDIERRWPLDKTESTLACGGGKAGAVRVLAALVFVDLHLMPLVVTGPARRNRV